MHTRVYFCALQKKLEVETGVVREQLEVETAVVREQLFFILHKKTILGVSFRNLDALMLLRGRDYTLERIN